METSPRLEGATGPFGLLSAWSGGLNAPDAPTSTLFHEEDVRDVAVRLLDRCRGVHRVRNVDVLDTDLRAGREEVPFSLFRTTAARRRLRHGIRELRCKDLRADPVSVTLSTRGLQIRQCLLDGGTVGPPGRGAGGFVAARGSSASCERHSSRYHGHDSESAQVSS